MKYLIMVLSLVLVGCDDSEKAIAESEELKDYIVVDDYESEIIGYDDSNYVVEHDGLIFLTDLTHLDADYISEYSDPDCTKGITSVNNINYNQQGIQVFTYDVLYMYGADKDARVFETTNVYNGNRDFCFFRYTGSNMIELKPYDYVPYLYFDGGAVVFSHTPKVVTK